MLKSLRGTPIDAASELVKQKYSSKIAFSERSIVNEQTFAYKSVKISDIKSSRQQIMQLIMPVVTKPFEYSKSTSKSAKRSLISVK